MNKAKEPVKKRERELLSKVVVNAGIGRVSGQQASFEDKILPQFNRDLAMIAGQKAQLRKSRISIAGFKMRQGQVVGLRVTLRRRKMVDFFERLIKMVLPRVRDFGGINLQAIDENGSLNLGFREQYVFPEINPEESTFVFSLGVNIVPRTKNRAAAIAAYRELGVPLRTEQDSVKKQSPRRPAKKAKK